MHRGLSGSLRLLCGLCGSAHSRLLRPGMHHEIPNLVGGLDDEHSDIGIFDGALSYGGATGESHFHLLAYAADTQVLSL